MPIELLMNQKQKDFLKTHFGFMKKSVFPQMAKKTFEGDLHLQAVQESNWSGKWQISFRNHTGQRFRHNAKTGHIVPLLTKLGQHVWVSEGPKYYWQVTLGCSLTILTH